MRGLVAVCMTLAVAAFSGCVELVGEDDPELDAAAAEADRLLDEYNDKVGHIAGKVLDSDGNPLAGATVDLVTVETLTTDASGRFSFLDLAPGAYALLVSAQEHVESQVSVDVLAGQFARPDVVLEAIPAPEPYFTTFSFSGYSDVMTPVYGLHNCYCQLDGELDSEGLSEIIVEAVMGESSGPWGSSDSFYWNLEAYNEEDYTYFGGYEANPMRVSVPGEEVTIAATNFYLMVEPYTDLLTVTFSQQFDAYLTAFYNGPAPEGFSALLLEEDEP